MLAKVAVDSGISTDKLKEVLRNYATAASSHIIEEGDLNICDMVTMKVQMSTATELVL